jgi:arabinose-5-phosphate isomerase
MNSDVSRQELARQALLFFRDTRMAMERLECSGIVPSLVMASESICGCRGKVVTTGMGKAGHAAQKIASTFSSLGIPSCYLHPAEASHGDIGIATRGDILLVFSTSGKTREVIETAELFRRLSAGGIDDDGGKVVSITSHPDSPIRSMSDVVVDIGIVREAGHLSLAPTTSIVVMLVVADAIATMCAWRRGLTKDEFGMRHHGGYLGRKCRGEEP